MPGTASRQYPVHMDIIGATDDIVVPSKSAYYMHLTTQADNKNSDKQGGVNPSMRWQITSLG